jgi:uncharacterized membrane protein YfcA
MDILLFIISFVASFLFSLGGIGAAIILIPIMVYMGIPINTAKPVGLFYNTISMTGASITNIRNKNIDFKMGIPIIISSFIFASIGAYLSKFLPGIIIMVLFAGFLIFSGLMFLLYKKKSSEVYTEKISSAKLTLLGAFAGTLSGMLGIGGGSIISPLMLLLGFNPKKTTAITAFVIPFSSFSGFLTYWVMGNINWRILLIVSIAGTLGATSGTVFMNKKLNPTIVKKILAVILLITALKLIINILNL